MVNDLSADSANPPQCRRTRRLRHSRLLTPFARRRKGKWLQTRTLRRPIFWIIVQSKLMFAWNVKDQGYAKESGMLK
ncbi:hypothetical protein ACS0TY_025578 [Phlomoides rotata]